MKAPTFSVVEGGALEKKGKPLAYNLDEIRKHSEATRLKAAEGENALFQSEQKSDD